MNVNQAVKSAESHQQDIEREYASALADYEQTKAHASIWDTSDMDAVQKEQPDKPTQQETMTEINDQIKEIKEQEKKFKDLVERIETIKKPKNS